MPQIREQLPVHDPVLAQFLSHYRIGASEDRFAQLRRILQAFSRLPYENLTKILKKSVAGSNENARRYPAEVIGDHVTMGTGGTCFSLTFALRHLLVSLGWRAEPILADRPYGPDTHCALAVDIEGQLHLVDPGFLINEPAPLVTTDEARLATAYHEVRLIPGQASEAMQLHTVQEGRDVLRLTYKTAPVDLGSFFKAWDASFDWDMMRYPVVTTATMAEHRYLRGRRMQVRRRTGVTRGALADQDLPAAIAGKFGIATHITAGALEVLALKGENRGRTPVA